MRIALMRMMADEEREQSHNAACLTKFAELLLLNGIMTTEQMWAAFNLVGDMYHTSGAGIVMADGLGSSGCLALI